MVVEARIRTVLFAIVGGGGDSSGSFTYRVDPRGGAVRKVNVSSLIGAVGALRDAIARGGLCGCSSHQDEAL